MVSRSRFALHGFIEFKSLAFQLFPYIDSQTRRRQDRKDFDSPRREALARELLRRGVESRIISMTDERPLEVLMHHTERRIEAGRSPG